MNKVSRVKNENFTIISNVFLKDKNLSLKAKGFLAIVMGLPNDWEFSINGVCSILKEGKTAIYNVIDELKDWGYCTVVTCRDEKGRIAGNDYTFYETPQMGTQHIDNPLMENPNMDNQPQLNTNSIKDVFKEGLKEIERNQKKEEEELFARFEEFANEYKKLCGKHTVSGIKNLYEEFKKRHKDWKDVIPLLMPALKLEHQARTNATARLVFYPTPKNLSTYLGKQRAWEVWVDEIAKHNDNQYTPQCDGVSLMWNDHAKCYMTPFEIYSIADGYTNKDRPNGAVVMWRGYKYIWNGENKEWIKE